MYAALRQFGRQTRTLEEMRHFVGNGVRHLMDKAVPGGEANEHFEECFAVFKEVYARVQTDTTGPYEGIPEAVAALQAEGFRMAIVSNKLDSAVQDLNRDFFHMDIAIGEREELARKPAPDGVLLAMKELGADPARTVYVGDSDVDLRTAKNSGLPCISSLCGFRTLEVLQSYGAACIAETPAHMVDILFGKQA